MHNFGVSTATQFCNAVNFGAIFGITINQQPEHSASSVASGKQGKSIFLRAVPFDENETCTTQHCKALTRKFKGGRVSIFVFSIFVHAQTPTCGV
mmetsp:Transcript_6157/g.10541  ORF Transcript_6157/g.10541 Transcript_6157/m.10541 type:complete len:95 (+) Transcript_6157:250-534(+)